MIFDVKKELKKIRHKENLESVRLKETREIAEIWKGSIGKTNPKAHVLMELCCYLTLVLEWGDDVGISFDYDNKKITCKKNNLIVEI